MNRYSIEQQWYDKLNKLGMLQNVFITKNLGFHIMKKTILYLCIISVIISSGGVYAAKLSTTSVKTFATKVTSNPVTAASGQGVTVTAEIPVKVRVIKIVLYYRAVDASKYNSRTMHADKNGEYRYVISQSELDSPEFEYYIEATNVHGNILQHGSANLPLVVSFGNGSSAGNNNLAEVKGRNHSNDNKDPLWKNKWLWIGVGVLAAAAISNNNSDDTTSKPGFSITIEGPQPEPAAP
jgi:hypothetical protein